jgi:hypothetical protein
MVFARHGTAPNASPRRGLHRAEGFTAPKASPRRLRRTGERRRAGQRERARIAATPSSTTCARRNRTPVPVLATYFTVRRGRDPFFKFYRKTLFPRQVREYSEKYGIRFIGWYNVAPGWDFDNVILFDLPTYGVLDEMEKDTGIQSIAHRGSEWMMERHHSMFLRERMGPELKVHL